MELLKKNVFLGKNIWIYGLGRWQRDFEYVFCTSEIGLTIQGYVCDCVSGTKWNKKPLQTVEAYVKNHTEKDLLIVCLPAPSENDIKKLRSKGLQDEDYLYAEDLFAILNNKYVNCLHNTRKDIMVWGTGENARIFMWLNQEFYHITGFIDNNPSQNTFLGKPVIHPAVLTSERLKNLFVVVTPEVYRQVRKQLEGFGLCEYKEFIHYQCVIPASEVMRMVWQEKKVFPLHCSTMLNNADISGPVSSCCQTFLKMRIGNLIVQDMEDIWNRILHRIMAVSALNQTLLFCKSELCPALINKQRQDYIETYQDFSYPDISTYPVVTNVAVDATCNLYCESCRDTICIAKGEEQEKVDFLTNKVIQQVLPYTKFITLAGNGEVFLSKNYERIFTSPQSKNIPYVQILSNGTLFTKEKWNELVSKRTSNILFCVSIDAATAGTYKELRRGGNFEQLLKALQLISSLRESNKIQNFRMNFVVQRKNYKEIPLFIQLAKKVHADRVLFTKILNWGTYTESEFNNISMVDLEGNMKPELQEVFLDPICQDPIVDIGTFSGDHNYVDTTVIKNYYLWEIDNYCDMKLQDQLIEK